MTTVHIILRDTTNGLVDVETTVTDWNPHSNAQSLAGRINQFMSEVADKKDGAYVAEVIPKVEPLRIELIQ